MSWVIKNDVDDDDHSLSDEQSKNNSVHKEISVAKDGIVSGVLAEEQAVKKHSHENAQQKQCARSRCMKWVNGCRRDQKLKISKMTADKMKISKLYKSLLLSSSKMEAEKAALQSQLDSAKDALAKSQKSLANFAKSLWEKKALEESQKALKESLAACEQTYATVFSRRPVNSGAVQYRPG